MAVVNAIMMMTLFIEDVRVLADGQYREASRGSVLPSTNKAPKKKIWRLIQ